jgi:hypothetical protein
VHRGAERKLDLTGGELVGNRPRVGQRSREPVELRDHERVAGATRRQRLAQPRPVAVRPGQAVVDVDPFRLDAELL